MTWGIAVAAVVVALAGCSSTTAGTGSIAADAATGTSAPTTGGASPSGGAVPTRLPTPGTDPTTSTAPGKTVRFGSVIMPVPARWTAKVDGELLCMTASGDDGCTLQVVDIGRIRAQGGSVSTPDPTKDTGWWWGSDVPNCDPSGNAYVSVTKSTKVAGPATRPVGTKTALYGTWVVSCRGGELDFDPRLWWLPTSQIAFYERTTVAGSGEAVDTLLAGVRFGG
jgi:hypothetical protein